MPSTRPVLFAALTALALALPAAAAPVADSIADYATTTQGASNWSYGFFNVTAQGAYSTGGFVEFAGFSAPNQRWEASDAQVGADNNDYLSLNAEGGHPNGIGPDAQDANIWAVRRYTSEVAGPITILFDLRKVNITNTLGGGITGHIFVDGVELLSQFIANDDGTGVQGALLVDVQVGSLIDFALDPTGRAPVGTNENAASARADGSWFSAVIDDTQRVSEPAALWLVLLGGVPLLRRAAIRRRR